MAITVQTASRSFKFNGVGLTDPGLAFSVEAVKELYSAQYPDLLNAAVEGPEVQGNKLVWKFVRSVGTKG